MPGTHSPVEFKESEREEPRASDGQIVVVRPAVVETVGHVLGNLFQRIYHFIDQAGEADAVLAAQLESNTRQLEDFLQLVIDYFSPILLTLQYVPETEIVESLTREIGDSINGAVEVDARLPAAGRVLVDPGRLARGFGLLAKQLNDNSAADGCVAVHAAERPAGQSLNISVQISSCLVAARTSAAEIQWAVAEKILEVHGGGLQEHCAASGDVLWEIALPLKP